MIRNKWMWTGLLVCACIVAAVAVRPQVSKLGVTEHGLEAVSVESNKFGLVSTPSNDGAVRIVANSTTEHKVSFGAPRLLTADERSMLESSRQAVTEADKHAALEARRSEPRPPHYPSLDQGSDNCVGVPDLGSALGAAVASGTTTGFTDNLDSAGFGANPPACWQGGLFTQSLLGPDVYYKWTAPATGTFTFSLCNGQAGGNLYDTGISLWDFTCPTEPSYPADFICGNDDGGICEANFGSELTCLPLTGGQQILIVIDGYGTDNGSYTLDIFQCPDCLAPACPGGWTAENEPDCGPDYEDNTNGAFNGPTGTCNFTNITCGATICAETGTFLANGVDEVRDTDFYRLVLTDTTRVTWNATGEFDLSSFLLVPGPTGFECVADSVGVVGGPFNVAPCETLTVSGCLPQGEYWIFIAPRNFSGVDCGARYNFWVTCDTCTISECIDHFVTVDCVNGTTFSGTTVNAGNDCWVSGTSQNDTLSTDEIWEVTIPADGLYQFSLCTGTTSWDSYIFLTTGCCSGTILNDYTNDDDGCGIGGGLSQTDCLNLTAGVYYLIVEGWQATDAGPYTVTVECCAPCVVNCVDTEAEADCADGFNGTNDGCNMVVPSFENITCGQTICGSTGYYTRNDSSFRDLDWYVISIADTERITVTSTAEVTHTIFIIEDGCPTGAIFNSRTADPCSVNTINACLPPATYYVVVGAASGLVTAPCGSNYQLSVTCEPCVIPANVDSCPNNSVFGQNVDQPTAVWTFGTSESATNFRRFENFTLDPGEVIGGFTIWGLSLAMATNTPCDEDPMSFEVSYWSDSVGAGPDITNGFLCRDTVSMNRVATGDLYSGFPSYMWSYSYPEGQCCSLATGVMQWVQIKGLVGTPTNCRFLWGSSGGSTGGFSILYNANVRQTAAFNLALCLQECPVPCNPITDLRVGLADGVTGARLHFTAPQAANYRIYSTILPSADDNPDNGADPNYTQEAVVFYSAGDQVWTAPVGFVNYKKYVVVADCN